MKQLTASRYLKTIGRLFFVWAITASVGYHSASNIFASALPLLTEVVDALDSDFVPHIEIVGDKHKEKLQMSAFIVRNLAVTSKGYIAAGQTTGVLQADLHHLLVPCVLAWTFLFAAPVTSILELILRTGAGVVAFFVLLALMTSVQLIGLFDIWVVETTERAGVSIEAPWALQFLLFSESGGRWLIGIVVGLCCAAAARRLARDGGTTGQYERDKT